MPLSHKLTHDRQVLALALLSTLPAGVVALWFVWSSPLSHAWQWMMTALLGAGWLGFAAAARARVVRPLRTLSGLLAALREGDFSIQARDAKPGDALSDVMFELNGLIAGLREQRLGALEATALLRTVMEEINLAVFAFDDAQTLRLVNRAGERLLAQPAERLLGRSAKTLGLADCLQGEPARTFQAAFPGGLGRWGLRRSAFRQGGLPHHLLVMADLSQALREEERQAWQRLLRVLGHELNNSLAPIKSISSSLAQMLNRDSLPEDWRDDAQHGLGAITARAEALSRFMEAYAKLARLPPPKLQPTEIEPLIRRVASLETRLEIRLRAGPPCTVSADADQLEQLLINLQRNAVDAALSTHGAVTLTWRKTPGAIEVLVEDEGPGLPDTTNLFVPFFTTKPGGSGVGLVLSRQIAEAHGGTLSLATKPGGGGCVARVRLPAPQAVGAA